jgi:hypothetical protein
MLHACRFLAALQAASALLRSLCRTLRSFSKSAMLTSLGAILPKFAVAVAATIAARTAVVVGNLLTVVAIGRSVRYSVLTPIYFTKG